jgi:hypothetical protein
MSDLRSGPAENGSPHRLPVIKLSCTASTTIRSNRDEGRPYPLSPCNSSLLTAVAHASLPLDGNDALVLTWALK